MRQQRRPKRFRNKPAPAPRVDGLMRRYTAADVPLTPNAEGVRSRWPDVETQDEELRGGEPHASDASGSGNWRARTST
jgi:hypothetical protein